MVRVAGSTRQRSSARIPPTQTTAPAGAVRTTGTEGFSAAGTRAELSRSDSFFDWPCMPSGQSTSPGRGPSTQSRPPTVASMSAAAASRG